VLYFGVLTGSPDRALTMAFCTFVLFQFFNLFNARNEYESAFNAQLFTNPMLWISVSATAVLQVIAVHWPPASLFFGTTGMLWEDWWIPIAVASSILVIEEVRKLVLSGLTRSDAPPPLMAKS
jgi:P-type Ca2+ transporter type 2C